MTEDTKKKIDIILEENKEKCKAINLVKISLKDIFSKNESKTK